MFDVKKAAAALTASYAKNKTEIVGTGRALPDREEIAKVLEELRKVMFPAFFAGREACGDLTHFIEVTLQSVYYRLKKQIELALHADGKNGNSVEIAEETAGEFVNGIAAIRDVLFTDLQATFEGDPAAKSKEEIVFSYPGFYAVFVYRVAHALYQKGVPFIPRMMTEIAHGKTGIDVHPGATIGEYFFIDHGTGIVIGETSIIGKRVKIYQMVTLGALSPRKGQLLSGVKRHPTVKDDVTIYSGASILGGDTVIGEGAVIGGNCFLTESVGAGMKVTEKPPELIIK